MPVFHRTISLGVQVEADTEHDATEKARVMLQRIAALVNVAAQIGMPVVRAPKPAHEEAHHGELETRAARQIDGDTEGLERKPSEPLTPFRPVTPAPTCVQSPVPALDGEISPIRWVKPTSPITPLGEGLSYLADRTILPQCQLQIPEVDRGKE